MIRELAVPGSRWGQAFGTDLRMGLAAHDLPIQHAVLATDCVAVGLVLTCRWSLRRAPLADVTGPRLLVLS